MENSGFERSWLLRLVLVAALLLVGGLVRYGGCSTFEVSRSTLQPTPIPSPISAAVLALPGEPLPTLAPGQELILAPTSPPPTATPAVTPTPLVPTWLQESRNLVGVISAKAGTDVYSTVDLYWDGDHVGGVALLGGRPRAHLEAGDVVLVQSVWGLVAEVYFGEGWQAKGWVSVRDVCTNSWCLPVR